MIEVCKSVIVPYSNCEMFELVSNINNYPQYLPWCNRAEIKAQNDNIIIASLSIDYYKIKTTFTTKNTNIPYEKIIIELVDGPFQHLYGYWQFISLGNSGCKVEFLLHYQYTNAILAKLISPAFSFISNNIMNCFIKQANQQFIAKI